jgi:hypothetical protein
MKFDLYQGNIIGADPDGKGGSVLVKYYDGSHTLITELPNGRIRRVRIETTSTGLSCREHGIEKAVAIMGCPACALHQLIGRLDD